MTSLLKDMVGVAAIVILILLLSANSQKGCAITIDGVTHTFRIGDAK